MTHSLLSRRALCAASGPGLVTALAGGMVRVGDGADRLADGEAYSLWHLWNDASLQGTPLALVAAAVLAANPHDTQPWLFHLRADKIDVYADLSRNLGAMDAYVREMHVGLGCAIQNALLAAAPNGYAAELEMAPGSLLAIKERHAQVPAATLHLSRRAAVAPDSLYRAIARRHTNRYAYDRARALPTEWCDFAAHSDVSDDVRVFLFGDGLAREAFDRAVVEATEAIIADRTMIADSDRWFRGSHAEIEAHRDGPTLDAAGLSPFILLLAKMLPLSTATNHEAWLIQTRDTQVATAPLAGLIAVRDRYDRRSAIAAGRTWQRLHLSATVHGIAMQPLNQPIEMVDRDKQTGRGDAWARRLAELTGPEWQATFLFRAGFAESVAAPSPRRALRDVVRL